MNIKVAVKILFVVAVLLPCSPFSSGADIYTWVGQDGVHHFSSERPADPDVEAHIFLRAAPYKRQTPPVPSASEPPATVAESFLTRSKPASAAADGAESADFDSTMAPPLPVETSPHPPEYASRSMPDASPSPEPEDSWTVTPSRLPTAADQGVIALHRHHRSPAYREHQQRLRHRFLGTPNYHHKYHRRFRPHQRRHPGANSFSNGFHRRFQGGFGGPEGRHSIRKPDRPRVRHRFLPILPPDGQ
ncbi:MAG: hypothetical protein P8010_27415 [Desulfosarcinaceae bacterium]